MKQIETHTKTDKDHPIVKYLSTLKAMMSDNHKNEITSDWYYNSMYDLLLDAGMEMKNEPTIASVGAGIRLLESLHFEPEKKQCYYNSQLATISSRCGDEFDYCEGFAMNETLQIPIQHGWLRHKKTKIVVDLTWCREEIKTVPWPETKYFGIVIHSQDVKQGMLSGSSNCHIDGYWNGWTILKEKFLNNNTYNPQIRKPNARV